MARTRTVVSSVAAGLLLASAAAVASPAQAEPAAPVLIFAATDQIAVQTPGETFASKDVWVQLDDESAPALAGPEGGQFAVDDILDVTLCDSAGACTSVFTHDFSAECTAVIAPAGPFDLAAVLPESGVAHLKIDLRDGCGGVEFTTAIYLAGVTVLPGDPGVDEARCVKKAGEFPDYIVESPEFTFSAGEPTIADGKVTGTGTLNLNEKNNCSTQVKVSVEVRPCNPDVTTCGIKQIKGAEWVIPQVGSSDTTITGVCRKGVKKYRVQVTLRWKQLEDGIARRHSESLYGDDEGWVSLAC